MSSALALENQGARRKLQTGVALHLLPILVLRVFFLLLYLLLDGPFGWYLFFTAHGQTRVCFKKSSLFSNKLDLTFLLGDMYLKRIKGKAVTNS